MASVNKVILIGNLGADPEVKQVGSSTVANLRLATNEVWNDRDGNRQERTEWHSVTVWGKQAELCGQYLAKGRSVYVEGRLQSRTYTDKEGAERKVWDVVASQVTFLGGQDGGSQSAGRSSGGGGGWGGGGSAPSQSPQGGGGWGDKPAHASNGGWGSQPQGQRGGGWGGGSRGGERPGSDGRGEDPIPFGPVVVEVL